jgi:hypothetical protein
MKKKRWSDLTSGQQVAITVLAVAQIGLLAAALWDLAHRKADEVRGPRAMWAALVFIDVIGPIAYFTIGRKGGCCSCCWEKTEDSPAIPEEPENGSGPV